MHDQHTEQQRGPRILVGLHDVLIADVLTWLLDESGFRATACSGEPEVLLEIAARARPEAALVDPPALAGLRQAAPDMCIVVLVREVDAPLAHALVRYAVNGVIPLTTQAGEAVRILRQVIDGNVVYPSGVLGHLGGTREPELLSDRQREILGQVALGHSNDEIAQRLFISRNTVKFHLREIYARLGVRNRVEALQVARSAPERVSA